MQMINAKLPFGSSCKIVIFAKYIYKIIVYTKTKGDKIYFNITDKSVH